jgi:hypothetical protein
MITTRTTALIAAMSLLGTVAPAAFAQNTSVNTDDDYAAQIADIKQKQYASNEANAGNVKGDNNIVAGNNAVAFSLQDQYADVDQDIDDNDDFNTGQLDVCALVNVGIIC